MNSPALRLVPNHEPRSRLCGLLTDPKTALVCAQQSCRCDVLGVTVAELLARPEVQP